MAGRLEAIATRVEAIATRNVAELRQGLELRKERTSFRDAAAPRALGLVWTKRHSLSCTMDHTKSRVSLGVQKDSARKVHKKVHLRNDSARRFE